MSRTDWLCVFLIIVGVILILVGANYWNAVVGWLGVFLFVGAALVLVLLYVYHSLSRPSDSPAEDGQNP